MKTFTRLASIVLSGFALCGCGLPPQTDFPNALTGPDSEVILLDDVSKILNDSDLSDDEKRDALRSLGIEDEQLIDALLGA